MPFTLTMPKLSPTMATGTIAKWHKKVGDKVEVGDLLIEVSTDKATVEHNALDEGFLREILIQEGEDAIVNQPIAIFTETKEESIEGYKPEGETPTAAPVVEKEKKQTEEPLKKVEKGITAAAAFVPEEPLENYTFEMPTESVGKRIKSSPLAKRLAKEQGLDLTTVKGTGPGGRITSEDLEMAQKAGPVVFGHREMPTVKPGTYEEEKLSPIGKVIAQKLRDAKTFIPHIYVQQTINAQPLAAVYEQLRNVNIKVTYNDFVIRACALALRQHPDVNSGFNSVNNTIIRFKTIDIAVAVSTPSGLITPIIRHADFKNLGEIGVEIRNLAQRAKEGGLELHEFKGGSFTVSNLGMYGITDFKAIINPPQAAILAVGGIQDVPVVKNNQVVPGKTMSLTLSADHSVLDGVASAKFLKTVQNYLENPSCLLI